MALAVKRMTELELDGRRLLIREDLNAPIKDGKVTSAKRLSAALPTIEYALQHGARVALISHLGRPKGRVVEDVMPSSAKFQRLQYFHFEVPWARLSRS